MPGWRRSFRRWCQSPSRRLLLQLRRPVLHQRERIAAFPDVAAVDKELLAVGGHIERAIIALDADRLKQRVRDAKVNGITASIDVDSDDACGVTSSAFPSFARLDPGIGARRGVTRVLGPAHTAR